jgi:hypothetical protein
LLPPPNAGGAPKTLGISAKSIHRVESKGENRRPGAPPNFVASRAARRRRFELLRVAQSIVYDREKQAPEQARVCWCHRSLRNRSENAYVYRRDDGGGARLTGVVRCGSVWDCPVCCAMVAEQRRRELELAMRNHVAGGGHAYLITPTFPHYRDDNLAELLARFARALASWKNSKTYKRVMGGAGRLGSVRSLEVTWGENGWHPHAHELVFANAGGLGEGEPDDTGRLASSAIDELRGAWINALLKAGLATNAQLQWLLLYALDVRGGSFAAEYIAKFGHDEQWGMSSELTKQHAKVGARRLADFAGHVTPFQLLDWAASGDGLAWRLFREYSPAFRGKRMLTWSPFLKKRLGLGPDRSDEAIAADDTPLPREQEVGAVTSDQLAILVSRNGLGEFLELVAEHGGDQADLDLWISRIADRARKGSSHLMVRGSLRQYDNVN